MIKSGPFPGKLVKINAGTPAPYDAWYDVSKYNLLDLKWTVNPKYAWPTQEGHPSVTFIKLQEDTMGIFWCWDARGGHQWCVYVPDLVFIESGGLVPYITVDPSLGMYNYNFTKEEVKKILPLAIEFIPKVVGDNLDVMQCVDKLKTQCGGTLTRREINAILSPKGKEIRHEKRTRRKEGTR